MYPLYIFGLIAIITYSIDLYALLKVGSAIRNNPAGKLDIRQMNIKKLSDFMVLTAGGIQFIAIGISLSPPVRYFVNTLMGLTSLVFSIADYLMVSNKGLPDIQSEIHLSKLTRM